MRFRDEVLRAARLELGLTQEALAKSLGVTVRTYRRYENGTVNDGGFTLRNASRRTLLERMRVELGTTVAELVEESEVRLDHVLQPARHFVGRGEELDQLRDFMDAAEGGVLALIGLGGMGKTALVERFCVQHAPALIYSFYEDPRVEPFLERCEPLGSEALVVIDGLEVVQVLFEDGFAHGEISHPRLRQWLRRRARGHRGQRVLLTSRFAPVDLQDFAAYRGIELGPLSDDAVDSLMKRWGVQDIERARELAAGHALSAAMLASYIGTFLGGEAPAEWRFDEAAHDDALARRLHDVLKSYRSALPEPTVQALRAIARDEACTLDPVQVRRLLRLGLIFQQGPRRFAMHPFVRDAFRAARPESTSLVRRPGVRPEGDDELRVAEERVAQALRQDDPLLAHHLYTRELGGFAQLGLKLGAFALGRRVLAQLEPRLEGQRTRIGERAYASLVYEQGLYSGALGDFAHAQRCYSQLREVPGLDADLRTTAARAAAYTARLSGDLDAALDHVARAIRIAEDASEPGHGGRAYALRGAILADLGAVDDARAAFLQSEKLAGPAVARRSLWRAEFELLTGETASAEARTRSNRELCERLGWAGHVAHCAFVLGMAQSLRGEHPAEQLACMHAWTERSGEVELIARALALATRVEPSASVPGGPLPNLQARFRDL